MKRVITSLAAALLLFAMLLPLAGCSDGTILIKVNPTKQEKKVVAQIGGYDVYYDELRFITLLYKSQMEAQYGGEAIWTSADTDKYSAELSDYVMTALPLNYAALALAADNGITPKDKDVKSYMKQQMNNFAQEISTMLAEINSANESYEVTNPAINEEYGEQLAENNTTDRYTRFNYLVDGCVDALVRKYITDGKIADGDADVTAYIKNHFICTLHIKINNDDSGARARADEVLAKLNDGEDFNSLAGSKYNEDFAQTTTSGRYFALGEENEAYENAAKALKVGEYSGVVVSGEAFYIIKRLPIDDSYVNSHFDNLKSQYQYAVVNAEIREKQKALTVELTEFGKSIDLVSMK